MKPKGLALAVCGLATGVALAGEWPAERADINRDGELSVQEVMEAWPEVSTDDFLRMDTDGDGMLDVDELTAARETGQLARAHAG